MQQVNKESTFLSYAILSPKMLEQESPDHVLILPWNLISELTLQLSQYSLVIAMPEFLYNALLVS